MDIIFICKEATVSSFITNLTLAMEAQKKGDKAGVVFTEEALSVVNGASVPGWPPPLLEREVIIKISKGIKQLDIPAMDPQNEREINIKHLMEEAKERGVSLIYCPLWSNLLGHKKGFAVDIPRIEVEKFLDEILTAKTVIGSF